VPPPNYNEILLDVRQSHKPVILEGQSGTGKTSCVRHILAELDPVKKPEYLTARDPFHVRRIEKVVTAHLPGSYVIDDFHRLTIDLQEQIANVAKLSADLQQPDLPKLIIIGINQVGTQLIQLVPDIAKRTGIHRISPGRRQDIEKLIQNGCERLNIRIKGAEDIYNETRGDYWLTQQICQSICTAANLLETQEKQTEVTFSLADLRPRVVDKLRSNYYPAVKEFCRGRRFRPSNDPYFKLLHAVGQQDSSIVDLNEMANALPDVRGSINNIKEHRLEVLISSKPAVAERRIRRPGLRDGNTICGFLFRTGPLPSPAALRWEREGVRLIDQRALRVAVALDAVPGLLGHEPPDPGGFGTGSGSVSTAVVASASMKERAIFIGSTSVWDTIGTLGTTSIEISTLFPPPLSRDTARAPS
jgi:hypothetical protein